MSERAVEWGVRRTQGDVGSVMVCLGEWHADEMVEQGVGIKVQRIVTRSDWSTRPASEYVITRSNTVHRGGRCVAARRNDVDVIPWRPGDPKRKDSRYQITACWQCFRGRLPPAPAPSSPESPHPTDTTQEQ